MNECHKRSTQQAKRHLVHQHLLHGLPHLVGIHGAKIFLRMDAHNERETHHDPGIFYREVVHIYCTGHGSSCGLI
jgi:hypothetical protein